MALLHNSPSSDDMNQLHYAEEHPMSDEQYERGKALADKVLGPDGRKRHADIAGISPMHGRAILEYCYGQVW